MNNSGALIGDMASEITSEASVEVVGVGIWSLVLFSFLMLVIFYKH